MKAGDKKPTIFSTEEKPPPVEARVMVVTGAFRCRGYRDVDGVWRYGKDGTQIENVIGWYPFQD